MDLDFSKCFEELPPKKKRNKPCRTHYTPRVAGRICEHIALGKTLGQALAMEPLAPSMTIFWRWLDEHAEFREKYERARMMQADGHADKMLELAQEAINAPSKAAAIRVATDILRWQAEIRDPKKYGAKVQHELKAPPLKPEDLKKEIKRLEEELGVTGSVTVVE